jgi:hypothetical protein
MREQLFAPPSEDAIYEMLADTAAREREARRESLMIAEAMRIKDAARELEPSEQSAPPVIPEEDEDAPSP